MTSVLVTPASTSIASIEARIAPLRARLAVHPLYRSIRTEAQLRTFMQSHIFAVWDFMSLLKALQMQLTCVSTPWMPTALPESRRFINEIVLGEESDLFEGKATSHFELYLKAMRQAGADTTVIQNLLSDLASMPVLQALRNAQIPAGARAFAENTFALVEGGKLHSLAAAFTFGREDVIPDMFRSLVRDLNVEKNGALDTFIWYLERHIEVDGEDHGPLSLRMVADICGTSEERWEDAAATAEQALVARLALWDAILTEM
jgi:hypothetical protein